MACRREALLTILAVLTVVFVFYISITSRLRGPLTPWASKYVGIPAYKHRRPSNIAQIEASKSTVEKGDWGALHCKDTGFDFYLYSAFYDDRMLLEASGPAVVRVLGTSPHLYREDMRLTLTCMMWYPEDPYPEITRPETYGKTLHGLVFACPIKRKDAVPHLVSIVCSTVAKPQFYLKVETADKPGTKEDFAICVCASYASRDAHQLVEWMELQQIFGVSKITVYNHSIDDETARMFLHYVDEGLVEFRQTNSFWAEEGSPFNRSKQHKGPTINDCLYRNMYRFKKILVIDFDELIVPRLHANLSEMLAAIDRDYPTSHPARNYVFRNDYFPVELPPDEKMPRSLITMRYRKRLPPSPAWHWVKTIVNPVSCTNMHHHYCRTRTPKLNARGHKIEVNTTFGMNHHYKMMCPPSWKRSKCETTIAEHYQDDTMLRFKDKLAPRVARQLDKLNIKQ